jgi:hypothetical protein
MQAILNNDFVVGGLLANSGQWVAYHVTILYATLLLLQCVLLPETLYPRAAVLLAEARRSRPLDKSEVDALGIRRTKQLGYVVCCQMMQTKHPNVLPG